MTNLQEMVRKLSELELSCVVLSREVAFVARASQTLVQQLKAIESKMEEANDESVQGG